MLRRTITALLFALCTSCAFADPIFSLKEAAPGVYVHEGQTALMTEANRGDIANLGAIVGDEAAAVIDTGGSAAEGRAFLAALRQATDKPIRYVINTHVHPDHIFGNVAFSGEGATFVGHKNLRAAMASRGPHYLKSFQSAMGSALDGVELIAPTLLVAGETTLDLGGREIVLHAWRSAHTDDDLTVLDKKSGVLFAGDLLFLQHVPIIDASLLGFLEVVAHLRALPATRVVPGHGQALAPWPKALDDETAYLTKLTADLRAAIARGDGVAATAAKAGRSEKDKWSLFDDYNARNATAGYAELEWETP